MDMNTNNLGLSSTSNTQLERMIDDAAWITYPLHVLVGLIKTFVYTALFISFLVLCFFIWMFTAHDDRAELTKNFINEQSIYRVSIVNKTTYPTVARLGMNGDSTENLVRGCPRDSKGLKEMEPFGFVHNWLAEKSDVFQSAYIAASCNMVSLTERLKEAKGDFSRLPDMPNAPVALVSFLERTDENKLNPANAQYNWYTGMCLASAHCTDADFVPRNDSIWYDAITPQLTASQDAAVKALCATATPEFWIAAAHANGIYDKDAEFASYATEEQADLAKKLRHQESSSDEFAHEVEIGIGLYIAFVVLLCACFTRQRARCLSEKCRPNRAFLESATLQ
jgi:hypothetical protein